MNGSSTFGAGCKRHLLLATALVPLSMSAPAAAQVGGTTPVITPTGSTQTDSTVAGTGPSPVDTIASAASPNANTNEAQASSEIVVTGSRLGGGFTAPTPVTTVGQVQIQQRALTSVAELLTEVPQLRVNQNIGKSSEPVGQSFADLRGLGFARTLVLLDGRRIAATSPFGGIDTNIFPVSLISNVEVVTGGASAAYGSDAVAGVVNFSLEKNLQGVRLDASYGQSKYGDFRRPVVSAAVGHSFLDDRLHVEIAGDYYRNSGQTRQASRPWGRNQTILVNNPQTSTNGLPLNYIGDGARYSFMTPGGVIAVSPTAGTAAQAAFRGIQFGTNGTPTPFRYGSPIGAIFAVGGDGGTVEDDGNILPLIVRYTGYGRVSYDLTTNITAWGDFLYSRVKVFSDLAPNYDAPTVNATTGAVTAGIPIQRDNAYLPASIRALMVANNVSSITIGRINLEDGFSQNNSVSRAERFAGGLEGHFGDWKWDVSAQRSANYFKQVSVNNRVQSRWFAGLDAVVNPTTGQIVCRSTLTAPTNGCVPINPFGAGSISPAALAYYRGDSFYNSFQKQNIFAANLHGAPFSTWAGPVAMAAGGEYRHESIVSNSDPISQISGWRSINQRGLSGKLTVKEVYGEIAVPLAKDWRFAKDLELNGAIRYADYSTSGGVTTYKVGINYTPIADIRFRGTYSRDIRAANINELFSGQNQVINSIVDTRPGLTTSGVSNFVTQLTGGNRALQPEKANTRAFGFVFQPTFVPGFHASVDYYSIKINGAIAAIAPQTIVNNCAAGQTAFCPLITFNGSNQISLIQATLINTQQIKTSGVDFEASYRMPLNIFGQSGSLGLRGLATYVHDIKTTSSGITVDNLANLGNPDSGGLPEWRYNFDLTYAAGALKLGAYYRYIGGGRYGIVPATSPTDPAQNRFHGKGYVDLSAAYKLTDNVELYGKVDNLFNVYPPILPNSIVQPTVANNQMYDKIGRFFVGGVRVNF